MSHFNLWKSGFGKENTIVLPFFKLAKTGIDISSQLLYNETCPESGKLGAPSQACIPMIEPSGRSFNFVSLRVSRKSYGESRFITAAIVSSGGPL